MGKRSLQERLEAKATAKTVQVEEGGYLEGEIFDVDFVDNLGGYKGRTPILYMETADGPAKFFAMHLTAKDAVASARPQGGDTIGIARGPDGGEKGNEYRVYHVAVEQASAEDRYVVFDWSTPIISPLEEQEAKHLSDKVDDDLPF